MAAGKPETVRTSPHAPATQTSRRQARRSHGHRRRRQARLPRRLALQLPAWPTKFARPAREVSRHLECDKHELESPPKQLGPLARLQPGHTVQDLPHAPRRPARSCRATGTNRESCRSAAGDSSSNRQFPAPQATGRSRETAKSAVRQWPRLSSARSAQVSRPRRSVQGQETRTQLVELSWFADVAGRDAKLLPRKPAAADRFCGQSRGKQSVSARQGRRQTSRQAHSKRAVGFFSQIRTSFSADSNFPAGITYHRLSASASLASWQIKPIRSAQRPAQPYLTNAQLHRRNA